MQKAKLENWRVVGIDDPYKAPEAISRSLQGEVYGHPDFTDGETVTSSTIIFLKDGIAETKNTKYELGYPEGDYAAWCIKNGYNVWTGPK